MTASTKCLLLTQVKLAPSAVLNEERKAELNPNPEPAHGDTGFVDRI